MARPAPRVHDEDVVTVPAAVRFPVELDPPPGFDPDRLETWPDVAGRLEWVGGRLLYMPPCGDRQGQTVVNVCGVADAWAREHPEFVVGSGEAGVVLGDDRRGADLAIWRAAELGPNTGGYTRAVPVLAVEVAGRWDTEAMLRDKAAEYLGHGVAVVWIVLPVEREVVVLCPNATHRVGIDERLPAHPALPELAPLVADLLRTVIARG